MNIVKNVILIILNIKPLMTWIMNYFAKFNFIVILLVLQNQRSMVKRDIIHGTYIYSMFKISHEC
jgi:hypothetical protein